LLFRKVLEALSNALQKETEMTIQLINAGKRYNKDWIFHHLTYTFSAKKSYAIIGPNGSGKSTLLQVLSSAIQLNDGKSEWFINDNEIPDDKVYKHVALCAPYLEPVEEMTLTEFLEFHQSFKPFLKTINSDTIISEIGLETSKNKRINQFSSGMKQRVKLAQCVFSDTALVLLDEPCTNLDAAGIELYNRLIEQFCKNRTVVVSSNDKTEYSFCNNMLNIMDYKQR
ncbi:MAG TPA: ATP-binding cassette domain-containing protein, partial [Niabella sp.]|nr:ATP-binding cassette domain-containing protein [Niabella sp.]